MPHPIRNSFRNRLLHAFDLDDLEALLPCLEAVDLELRTVVTEAGKRTGFIHFIESGLASVVVTSLDEQERIEVGHIGREGATGAAACLGMAVPVTTTFMQVGGAAWRLRVADYERLAAGRPGIPALMLRYIYTQEVQVAHSALANARYNMRECLARWLLMSQDRLETDELPLTHEFLSLMLGVRRAGVTGELAILEGMGLVKATRGLIRIRDREGLIEATGGCYGAPEALYEHVIGARAS